jgi:hypothetical protein
VREYPESVAEEEGTSRSTGAVVSRMRPRDGVPREGMAAGAEASMRPRWVLVGAGGAEEEADGARLGSSGGSIVCPLQATDAPQPASRQQAAVWQAAAQATRPRRARASHPPQSTRINQLTEGPLHATLLDTPLSCWRSLDFAELLVHSKKSLSC